MSGGNIHPSPDREKVFGRKVEGLRWHKGRLQVRYSEKFERYEGCRYLCGGTREVWEDVPGDPPAPTADPAC
jgi:hypothetical protein